VMTVSPVEKPVASAAYSFVRFIGGGLAPYAAGRLVLATNIHVPFYIAAGAIALGIVVLSTAHGLLTEAERVQAEQVSATVPASVTGSADGTGPASATGPANGTGPGAPAAALVPVAGNGVTRAGGARVVLAAIDSSPVATLVTQAAGRLAARGAGVVHLVHTQEDAIAGDAGTDGEDLEAARAVVRDHLDQLAARHVPAEGHILLHALDHGTAGRMVAEYANTIGASTIVIGAPTHGELPALMDGSASRELWRHTRSNVLIVSPDAPGPGQDSAADAEPAAQGA
jgi:ACDE family multidrug resistance protein